MGIDGLARPYRSRQPWKSELHPRIPSGHGGGEFAHLPGAGRRLPAPSDTETRVPEKAGTLPNARFDPNAITLYDPVITSTMDELAGRYGIRPEIVLGGNSSHSYATTENLAPFRIHLDRRMWSKNTQTPGMLRESMRRLYLEHPNDQGYIRHVPAPGTDKSSTGANQFAQYLIEHEYGHVLYSHALARWSMPEVVAFSKPFRDQEAVRAQLGDYATYNRDEAVAEAFAVGRLAQHLGEPMPPLSRKVIDAFGHTFSRPASATKPASSATKVVRHGWDGLPWDQRSQEGPRPGDIPPGRTASGDFVLYHGTSRAVAERIVRERRITPDDFGAVGLGTTRASVASYAAMKAVHGAGSGRVEVVVAQDWLAQRRVQHEIGGSNHDQLLIFPSRDAPDDGSGLPPEAVVAIRRV